MTVEKITRVRPTTPSRVTASRFVLFLDPKAADS